MAGYYTAKRSRNLYEPGKPFRLSRSKIDQFLKCPRCFYVDRKLGISPPQPAPYTLNSAVDTLLKKEFDFYRAKGLPHPLVEAQGVKAKPFAHPKLDEWRDALRGGITYTDPDTNLTFTGGIDDLWINEKEELVIVDYKATVTEKEITLDDKWKEAYKRQVEIYQWLFRKNKFNVSDTAYFFYCNGRTDRPNFNGKLEFDIKLIPYEGDDSWVGDAVHEAYDCLMQESLPDSNPACELCIYNSVILAELHS